MLKNLQENKGITLVALVVTMVVLLILAGITISLLFAQNGVVTKAQEAAKDPNKNMIAENVQDVIIAKQMEILQDSSNAGDVTADLTKSLATANITLTGKIEIDANTNVTCTNVKVTFGSETYTMSGYTNGQAVLTRSN